MTKEKLHSMTDAQVILHASCHGVGSWSLDGNVRVRLEAIAAKLEKAERKARLP